MRRATFAFLTLAAMCALLASTGCANDKQTIGQLEDELADARATNQQLQQEYSDAQQRITSLESQLDQFQSALAAREQRIDQLQQELAAQPEEPTMSGEWEVGYTADRVTVGSDILFASGKAELTPAGKKKLDEIAQTLQSTYAGMPVHVVGYTDTDPIRKTKHLWKDNLDLSANRAMAVARHLISQGVDAKNIYATGRGEHHPLSTRAKSRRVEIIVVKQ